MKEKFVVSIIFPLLTNLFSIITNYILFFNISVDLVGTWTFLVSVIGIGFIFSDLGLETIHYQYMRKNDFHNYIGSYFLIKVVLILTNSVISITLIGFFKMWNESYSLILIFILISNVILNIRNVLLLNLRTKFKFIKSELALLLFYTLNNSLIVYLSLNIAIFSSPLLYLSLINLVSESFLLTILILLSKKELKLTKPKIDLIFSYFKDTKSVIIFSTVYIFTQNIGNLILYNYFGESPLAFFSFVYTIIIFLSYASITIKPILYSLYSKYFKENNMNLIKEVTHKIEKFFSIIYLGIIILLFLNGELILKVFIPNYLDSLLPLCIMLFIPYLLGIARPYQLQLTPGEKPAQSVLIDTFVEIFSLTLILVLIPILGLIGYAIALTLPRIFHAIMAHYFSKKIFNINSQNKIFFHFFLAFTSLIITYLIKNYILIPILHNQYLLLLISSGIILGINIIFLFSFKLLSLNDIKFLKELFQVKDYIESLKREFIE